MSQDGAFLFDQRRFWHDARVKKMTAEQVGIYLKMLSIQWEEGSLPVDADDLACEISEGRRFYTAAQLSTGKDTLSPVKGELMEGLQECFSRLDDDPSRMRNSYMHEVREEWRRIQKARREGGRRGGKKSRKPKRPKGLEGELKDTFEDTPKDTPKPSVSKGSKGKGIEGKERREEDYPPSGDAAGAADDKEVMPHEPAVEAGGAQSDVQLSRVPIRDSPADVTPGAAPPGGDSGKGKPGRFEQLTWPAILVEEVPDIRERWKESRKIRNLSRRTTASAEQKQVEHLADAAGKWGAGPVLKAIEKANRGSYQGIFAKAPKKKRGKTYGEIDEERRQQKLQAPAATGGAEEIDIDARLRRLAGLVPEAAEQILALSPNGGPGDAEAIDRRLAEIDLKLITARKAKLKPEEREAIRADFEKSRGFLSKRLPKDEIGAEEAKLGRRILRQALKLPELGLFTAEAIG